jgi:hypothetical protein
MVVRGSACDAASCTSRSGTPASKLGGGDKRVPQRVRADVLGDLGVADDPGSAVPVQPPPVRSGKQRPAGTRNAPRAATPSRLSG